MKVSIVAVGRLRPGPEQDLTDRYRERASQLGSALGTSFHERELAESRAQRPQDRRRDEASAILGAIPASAKICALDETGRALTSPELADILRAWRESAVADAVFLVGGPDGLDASIRSRADLVLSFGRATWPHQLIRAMLAEQLYRAFTILAGHPYHRG